jgi:very-short-patch-repair endonuclease
MTRMTAAQAKKLVKKSNMKTRALLSQMGSIGEETLARHLQVNKINYKREHEFNPLTKHRADFYLPEYNLLVEVEGGTKSKSRHTTHIGYSKDLEKYNMAQILGFSRLAFTTEQVSKGAAIQTIEMFIMAHNMRKKAEQQTPDQVLRNTDITWTHTKTPNNADIPDAIMEAQKHRPENKDAM